MFSKRNKKAVSEVISAIMVFAVTVSLLSGVFYFASSSLSKTEQDARNSNITYQKRLGSLLSLILENRNNTGMYLYFYSYGWEAASILNVKIDDKSIQFRTDCQAVKAGRICYLQVSYYLHGDLAIETTGGTIYESI